MHHHHHQAHRCRPGASLLLHGRPSCADKRRLGLEAGIRRGRHALPGWPTTVGELYLCLKKMYGMLEDDGWREPPEVAYRRRFPGWPGNSNNMAAELQHIQSLLPSTWWQTALKVYAVAVSRRQPFPTCTPAAVSQVHDMLVSHLGWRLPDSGAKVFLEEVAVAKATRLQRWCNPTAAAIQYRHDQCLRRVAQLDGVDVSSLPRPSKVCDTLWRLTVSNDTKELHWRLLLDSFPTTKRMPNSKASCPACRCRRPGVKHHFWRCPIARAVCGEVEGQLWQGGPPTQSGRLRARHLWLAVKPCSTVPDVVWRAVCLAATAGMEKGRRVAWRMGRDGLPPETVCGPAANAAVAAFWATLTDASITLKINESDLPPLITSSPFLQWRDGGLCVLRGDLRFT
jgi:hypothetical protein